MTNTPELVVVDLAGTTVVDGGVVEDAFAAAWDRVCASEGGRDAAMAYVRATMGQSKIEVFRTFADETTAQALNRAFEDAYREGIEAGRCEAIPGAEEVMRDLRSRGIRIAITTGFSRVTANAILDSLGWSDIADVVLTPADAGRGRPAPDLPLMALIRTGASAVNSMVVVGDTESDAASGRAAGAGLVVGVLTGGRDEALLREAGADLVLASIAELPAALG